MYLRIIVRADLVHTNAEAVNGDRECDDRDGADRVPG